MKCVKCQLDIPLNSRYCLVCGAEQPSQKNGSNPDSAPGSNLEGAVSTRAQAPGREARWVEHETPFDPGLDYEARQRFDNLTGGFFSCLGYAGIIFFSIIAIMPGVPLLALFGIPAALILGVSTYLNGWNLQQKWRRMKIIKDLPGFSGNRTVQAISVTAYLSVISIVCIILMRTINH